MSDSAALGGFLGGFGGGAIGRAVVDLILNNAAYEEQLAASEAQTVASTETMSASYAGVGKAAASYKTTTVAANEEVAASNETVATSAGSMGLVYAAAGIAAAEFAKNSVAAAIEQQQATDKLNNSIINSSNVSLDSVQAFNDQANSLRNLTGVSDEAVTSGQALLVQMGLTADQITQLTPLVVDLSAKNGIDLNAAFKAVGKAAEGSTGALARYIGPIEKGSTKAETFQNVLQKLAAVQGYAAEKADAEPWIKLTASFHELEEAAGKQLLPALQDVAGVLADISTHKLPDAGDALGVLKTAFEVTNPTMAGFINLIHDAPNATGDLQNALNELQHDIDSGAVSTDAAAGRVAELGKQFHLSDGTVQQLTTAITDYAHSAGGASQASTDLANSHHAAAQAARDQKLAEDQLAGGALGLISSLEQLQADQDKYNKLQEKGKIDSKAGHEVTQSILQDQVALNQQFQDYIKNAKQAGDTSLTFQQVLKGVARQGGISQQALKDMLDSVSEHGKGANTTLDELQRKLNKINSTKVTVPIEVQIAGIADTTDFYTRVRALVQRELARQSP